MPRTLPRILVVGAGPTGLTAALELARRGLRPRIIDRDEGPTPLSKAVGISPHSLDLLHPSGVADTLLSEGIRVRGAQVRYHGRRIGAVDFGPLPHRYNFLLSLPQSQTETVMARALAGLGVTVEWGVRLTDLTIAGQGASVALEGPRGRETADFDLIFGADGVHSRVREAAGIAFEGYDHRRQWSIADVEIGDWPHSPDLAQVFFHPDGDVGFIIPIGEGRFRAVSNTPDAMARIHGDFRVDRVLRTDLFPLPIRQASTYRKGPVFLGGDAAHVHSPLGARGMNLGIEDAAAFARRVMDDDLAGYCDERRPVGRRWIRLSEGALAVAQARSPLVIAGRNLAIRLAGWFPVLLRPALERVAGLKE
ncbi:MAG: FAD-dependent monooxygenase [Caulobacter sp.]|nr:FAD-dependent monooxygenase [Caulobacter sp.]